MTKRIFAVLTAFVLLCACLPLGAVNVSADAQYRDLYYEIVDGAVTITDCNWDVTGKLIIPAKIEGYPVKKIGNEAFKCCSFTEVVIPNSVTEIGTNAFEFCDELTSINIPEELSVIPYGMFRNCSALTNVTLPESIIEIRTYAFCGCDALTEMIIPDNVQRIWDYAFSSCENLTAVTIGEGVTTINNNAFRFCASLTTVTIPANTQTIDAWAFSDCDRLTHIYVANGNRYYASVNGVLFNKDKTKLIQYPGGKEQKEYVIPATVTTIGDGAFAGVKRLVSLTIPEGVTEIEESAFIRFDGINSLIIPEGVTVLNRRTFYRCQNLKQITLPISLTMIGEDVFAECFSLEEVYYIGDENDRNGVQIEEGNTCLTDATWHYDYGKPPVDDKNDERIDVEDREKGQTNDEGLPPWLWAVFGGAAVGLGSAIVKYIKKKQTK